MPALERGLTDDGVARLVGMNAIPRHHIAEIALIQEQSAQIKDGAVGFVGRFEGYIGVALLPAINVLRAAQIVQNRAPIQLLRYPLKVAIRHYG